MKKKHVIFIVTMVLVLGIGGFWLFMARGDPGKAAIVYSEIGRGDLELTVSSTGTLSAVGTVEVGAQVSADLEKIHVNFNDRVKKGQVLAEFDTALLKAEVDKAEANVMRQQAALEKAAAEYRRNQPLFEKGFLSETEFLAYKLDLQSGQAELKSARAALNVARVNLRYAVIRSPVDGTVIERSVEEGQTLVARMETPKLFVIAEDLSKMQIEVAVDESDIGRIREGQAVRFTVQAYPDDTFEGEVRQIRLQPETVQNVVNYTVIVDASNQDGRLLPGMTATVDFIVEHRKDVLLVPNRAIQFRPPSGLAQKLIDRPLPGVHPGTPPGHANGRTRVFIDAGENRIRPVVFTEGISDGKMTEVLDGQDLRAGMRVAVGKNGTGESKAQKRSFRLGSGPRRGGPPPF